MISIHVYREPCVCITTANETIVSDECLTGDTITDSLIVSDLVAIANATSKIDKSYSNRRKIECQTRVFPYIANGSIVSLDDKESGIDFCMIDEFSLKYTQNKKSYSEACQITLEAKI